MYEPIHNTTVNPKTSKTIARKRIYTVWIVPKNEGGWLIYYCPDCRNPIAQYDGELVAEIPGEVSKPYPVMIQCRNSKCGRKIMFKEIAEQVE